MIKVAINEKSYGNAPVLGQVHFEIAPGETVAVVGPSGIGKSTLLRIVAGIDTEFDGKILAPDNIGLVFQEPTLLPWRSTADNIRLLHPNLLSNEISQILEWVGLAGKEEHFPGQLSLGQQRRLSLARAFAGQPKFLIMDEPFVSLDEQTAEQMILLTESLLIETRPSMLLVTHAAVEAQRLSDRIITLAGSPAMIS